MGDRAATADGANLDPASAARLNSDFPVQASRPIDRADRAFFSRTWPTRSLEAYASYWRGRAYYDRSTGRKPFAALPYFERAAALDSSFALAHAGLAVTYLDRAAAGIAPVESAIKARHAAHRAHALDSQSAETHVALAELSYRLDDDVRGAQRAFARAVELDGRNAYVRQRYAVFLQEQRRFDDALEQLRVAQDLDPLSVVSSWQMADTLFLARRWEESLAQSYHTLELDPTHSWSFRTIGQSLDAMGKREEAIEAYLKAGNVASGHLGRVYALMGRRSAAHEILATLTRRSGGRAGSQRRGDRLRLHGIGRTREGHGVVGEGTPGRRAAPVHPPRHAAVGATSRQRCVRRFPEEKPRRRDLISRSLPVSREGPLTAPEASWQRGAGPCRSA